VLLADPASGGTSVTSVTGGAGINASPTTGAVTVTNTWGAVPTGTQTQFLRIKPNTGNNTTFEFTSGPVVNSADYDFPTQSPGGSITIGANAIHLAPCPVGLAGTDTDHFVYLSAGTGTAEAVLITGGTCTSGAAAGTIIFTAAYTHSGAWTVTSAGGGIPEAVQAVAANGNVFVNALSILYAPVTIRKNLTISSNYTGSAGYSVLRSTLYATGNMFDVQAGATVLFDHIGIHQNTGSGMSGTGAAIYGHPGSTAKSSYVFIINGGFRNNPGQRFIDCHSQGVKIFAAQPYVGSP
jgi:hypothetical protein